MSSYETVLVEYDDGIAWVTLNRPEKRNAMSPTLNAEMLEALDEVEASDARVMVLTGAGEAFTAGMDIREFFRETDAKEPHERAAIYRNAFDWQTWRLQDLSKPTIAMVNGWCFGGGFDPLSSCDIAIAAEDAIFGISEVNWGIIPGGLVSYNAVRYMPLRKAMYYSMTGRTFTGKEAADMGLVTYAVPADTLRQEVTEVARELIEKNPATLRGCRECIRHVGGMDQRQSLNFLYAKYNEMKFFDSDWGRQQGMAQFLDEKTYRPGVESADFSRRTNGD